MKRYAFACTLALSATIAGCLDPFEPDVGPPLAASCIDIDSDEDVDVGFDEEILSGIFEGRCFRCHTPGGSNPIGFEVGGLDLTSYATLLEGGVVSEADIVVPGRPCDSVLVQKTGGSPPFGARMPLGGPPYLSDDEQRLVRDWIAEGARDN
jgi:hypothetical protein